jgi:Spy/CpxP family protein refolding chaperone
MRIATVTLAVLLCAATGAAQTVPAAPATGAPRGNLDQLKTFLSLTDPQIQQIKNLEMTQRAVLRPMFKDLATIGRDLRAALKKEPVDPARVTQLRAELQSKRTDIQTQRAVLRTQIQGVLTTQQQAQLQQLQDALNLQAAARQAAMLDLIQARNGLFGMRGRLGARFMAGAARRRGRMAAPAMQAPKASP